MDILLESLKTVSYTHLLINTNKMIGEVAEEVGYQSLPYFFKLFQMHENCSPAQYRRKNRASE